MTIFDKEPPHRVLYAYDGGSFPPIFKDVDGNGQYEVVAGDWTYESWPYGYVSTPAPRIIWRMTPSGFSLATDLMLKPLPDASTLANYKADIEKEFDIVSEEYPCQYCS